jgi:hypothetical protein
VQKSRAPVVAIIADSENFRSQLVDEYWSAARLSPSETQEFSSELIRAIPLLGIPYDLDHPIYGLDRATAATAFARIVERGVKVHREHLSLQYERDVTVLTIHPSGTGATFRRLNGILGDPELFKIKVVNSRFQEQVRFVSVACFPPALKEWLVRFWHQARLPNLSSPLSMYRVLCFAAARSLAESLDPSLTRDSLLVSEAELSLTPHGLGIADQVAALLKADESESEPLPSRPEVTPAELEGLGQAFSELKGPSPSELAARPVFERICMLWQSVFREVERGFRQKLDKELVAGSTPKEIFQSVTAKRLQGGLTARQMFNRIAAPASLKTSIAMDLAVDSGVLVPTYAETASVVARAYHHGESVWDGMRFGALIARVLSGKRNRIKSFQTIEFEKWLVVLYDLAYLRRSAMLTPTVHYLENPSAEPLDLSAIKIDFEFREHGRTLEASVAQSGLSGDGDRRWASSAPVVYWLERRARVLVRTDTTYSLSTGAEEQYLSDIAVPPDVLSPVGMLFEFLACELPQHLRIDGTQKIDKSDILRLLSSCPSTRLYLRSIAEDAILIAQRRLEWVRQGHKSDEQFWVTTRARGPANEIYRKWRVFFYRDKIVELLRRRCEDTGTSDKFNLFILPLIVETGNINVRARRKIEDRCLSLFMCIELASSRPAVSADYRTAKRKAIAWLRDRGYAVPPDRPEKLIMARDLCTQILDMFPSLIRNLGRPEGDEELDEYFIFSDIRDSSQPGEVRRAEDAKAEFVIELRKLLRRDPSAFHFNDDMNDEKDLYAIAPATATQALSSMIRKYSANDKYGRIGIVSSIDTLEKAKKVRELPSSPTNFMLAKKIGCYLKDNRNPIGAHVLADLDKRRADQRYGIIAISAASQKKFAPEVLFSGTVRFADVDAFLESEREGWVQLLEDSTEVGKVDSPHLRFAVFLYR